MTREEAINCIKYGIIDGNYAVPLKIGKEALNMAIKALEQLPKLQNRCFALTQGQICMFCPYDCENRTTEHRSEEDGNNRT